MRTTRNLTDDEIRVAVERAEAHYYDVIKDQLTDADKGRYIAIDGNTLEWEIDDTDACCDTLKKRVPDAIIYMVRHITIVSAHIGAVPDGFHELIREDEARLRKPILAAIRDRFPERVVASER